MSDRIIISAIDTERLNELAVDKQAAAAVFDAAQRRYHNSINGFYKREAALWDHFREVHNLDLTTEYVSRYNTLEGQFVITEKED